MLCIVHLNLNRTFIFFLALYCLLMGPFGAPAQQPFMFHYSVKDGLPSNETYSILEDSKGYIWICTDAGIARYNANSFKIFDSSSGLPDNTVFDVMEDRHGRIWFFTFSGGVGYIHNDSVVSIGANPTIIRLQAQGMLASFAIDEKDNLIIGTRSFDNRLFIHIAPPYGAGNVRQEMPAHAHDVGLTAKVIGKRVVFTELRSKVLQKGDSLYALPLPFSILNSSGKECFTDSLSQEQIGPLIKLYLGGDEVICMSCHLLEYCNLLTGKVRRQTYPGDMTSLLNDSEELLIGRRGEGVTEERSGGQTQDTVHYLDGKSISALYRDSHKGYWYATLEDGVYYSPDKDYYKIRLHDGTGRQMAISAFLKTGDSTLLAGTESGEVWLMKRGKGKMQQQLIYSSKAGKIMRLQQLNSRQFIVVSAETWPEIIDLQGKTTLKREAQTKFIRCYVAGDHFAGALIAAITRIDTATLNITDVTHFSERITGIARGSNDDEVLISSLKGLYILKKPGSGPVQLFNIRVEDAGMYNDFLFAASKSNGLIVSRDRRNDTITIRDGLLSNVCRRLFFIGKDVWLLTNKGLCQLDYSGYKKYTIRNFPFSNHIFPETVDQVSGIGNSLVFLDNGALCFYPLHRDTQQRIFRISALYANDLPVKDTMPLQLSYDRSNITVNLEALFYEQNGDIVYRYRFENEREWEYTTRNVLSFPSLAPGRYRLLAQALDEQNRWVDCASAPVFIINAPFWQQWWFIFLIVISVCFIGFFIFSKRHKDLLEKERVKNALNSRFLEMEIKVLKTQMDPHFIFNSLNTIQQFILIDEKEKAQTYLVKFSKLLRRLLESSTKEAIRLSAEIEDLKRYLEMESIRFSHAFQYNIVLKGGLQPDAIFIPHFMIQPFVENAIWHGLLPKAGDKQLLITFEQQNDALLCCTIDDNGIGRSALPKQDDERRSMAIGLIRQRLLLMSTHRLHYTVTLIDKLKADGSGDGTKVIILLPLINH